MVAKEEKNMMKWKMMLEMKKRMTMVAENKKKIRRVRRISSSSSNTY